MFPRTGLIFRPYGAGTESSEVSRVKRDVEVIQRSVMGWVMGFEPTASGTTILENLICNDIQGYLLNLTLIQAVYSRVET
jgi:hypothetical protein